MELTQLAHIIGLLRQDEARLKAVELLPTETQERYAPGIAKLRWRIYEERRALGIAPEDTEAWAKWLLEDFDYDQHPGSTRNLINQYLALVEDAREQIDLDAMHDAQRRLERFIHDISAPEQLEFGA